MPCALASNNIYIIHGLAIYAKGHISAAFAPPPGLSAYDGQGPFRLWRIRCSFQVYRLEMLFPSRFLKSIHASSLLLSLQIPPDKPTPMVPSLLYSGSSPSYVHSFVVRFCLYDLNIDAMCFGFE